MYNYLGQFRKWILRLRPILNEAVGQTLIPDLKKMPDKKGYASLPVIVLSDHWIQIREIRVMWDALVRDCEEDWDSKFCVRRQTIIVQGAAVIFNNACVPYEIREANEKRNKEQLTRMFQELSEVIARNREPVSETKTRKKRSQQDQDVDD